jgi:hypothetical protein
VELSRLACSSQDGHQRLETCAVFGTLIADLDGIYEPSHANDRLWLGLKGTMREAAWHVLKHRMDQGKRQKARRGERRVAWPIGYVWDHAGAMALDPDAHVPHVVRLVFRTLDELGTRHALVRDLVQQGLELGVRRREGPTKGMLEWRGPKRTTWPALLRNPIDAGAYADGRRQVDGRTKRPGRPSSGRVGRAPHESHGLLHKHVPASITGEPYEPHLARWAANRAQADALGAVRQGPALLAGLVIGGTCKHRVQVRYGGSHTRPSDVCGRSGIDDGGAYGQALPGEPIDTFVTPWVLNALEPAALTLSLAATARLEHERQEVDRLGQQRWERAAYARERAARHYRVVEPEHRLVARQLAKDWEDKRTAQRQRQEDYERVLPTQAPVLSRAARAAIEQLAQNIPALWPAATTPIADRKELIRQMIPRVMVRAEGLSERLDITIEWVGGGTTAGVTTRPMSRPEPLRYDPLLCERIRALAAAGYSTVMITSCLAQEGFRSPKQERALNRQTVIELMRRLGVRQPHRQPRPRLSPHEWRLSEWEQELGRANSTRHLWRTRGWLQARWHEPEQCWVVWADETELNRLNARGALSPGAVTHNTWLEAQLVHQMDSSRLTKA